MAAFVRCNAAARAVTVVPAAAADGNASDVGAAVNFFLALAQEPGLNGVRWWFEFFFTNQTKKNLRILLRGKI